MNHRLIALPLALILGVGTACTPQAKVEHPWVGGDTTTTTPASTTTSVLVYGPTKGLDGFYCWTERNTQLPEGVEKLCSTDLNKVNKDAFLHWGGPLSTDYR